MQNGQKAAVLIFVIIYLCECLYKHHKKVAF